MRSPRPLIFVALFLAGAGLRAIDLWHPVDGTVRESWRECDYASIARNYYREDSRFLHPRIDWRGDGPGYAEMELPVTPWATSLLYRAVGFHEVAGRVLVYALALLTLAVFFRLAAYLLPPSGAVAAGLFFALSPLAVRISNTLQPEAWMLLTYILAVYGFVRWLDSGRWRDWALAAVATAVTILAKSSTAHIGILFAVLFIARQGWGALRRPSVWAMAAVALVPPLAWYAYAHGLWVHYGNSLGVSNEYHWIGWDFFTNPKFIKGILVSDVFFAWMPTGILVAVWGVVMRFRERGTQVALAWLLAVAVFYVVASRTTDASWAVYYHVVSVPVVALLFGIGVEALGALPGGQHGRGWWRSPCPRSSRPRRRALRTPRLGFGAGRVSWRPWPRRSWLSPHWPGLRGRGRRRGGRPDLRRRQGGRAGHLDARRRDGRPRGARGAGGGPPRRDAAVLRLRAAVCAAGSAGELIVVSGDHCTDADGYPVAYNEPFMFYWMDRKGFNLCTAQQSLPAVQAFARRGARFFAAKGSLPMKPGFEHVIRATYPVLSECIVLRPVCPAAGRRGGSPP